MSSRYGSHALAAGARLGHARAESVDTPSRLAGFEAGSPSESVDTPSRLAGFGVAGAWRARGARTAIPAALRYALAVSRRTPVAFSISRRLQPSPPSAITWLY